MMTWVNPYPKCKFVESTYVNTIPTYESIITPKAMRLLFMVKNGVIASIRFSRITFLNFGHVYPSHVSPSQYIAASSLTL